MKKNLLFVCMSFLFSCYTFSQGVGIGTTTPDASAALDITNNAKGLLVPRMNTISLNAISSPARGLLIYDSVLNQLMINIGTNLAPNWQPVGPVSAQWKLTGNNGINPSNQFIGTTDNQPLHFRINNIQAGELHPANGSIFWGVAAGQSNTTGINNIAIGTGALKSNAVNTGLVAIGDSALFNNASNNLAQSTLNTAVGSKALFSNTTGFNNTASGAGALRGNTSGSDNTAVGVNALFSNTTGFVNTAMGFATLFSNTTGNFNAAFGEFALHDNTTGFNNTAVGNFSLQFDITGSQNTAVGNQALKINTTGDNNAALGVAALFNNTTGFQNTALGNFSLENTTIGHDNIAGGINALINNTTGSSNVAFGNFAGDLATTDNNNTFIGFGANNTSGVALSNSTALGFGSSITASNQVRFGNASVTSIGGVVGYTTISDGRFKKDVTEEVKGIDFIMKLRPVTYHLDIAAINKKLNRSGKYTDAGQSDNTRTMFSGFVAQEVERAAKAAGYEFSGVDKPKNENDMYGLRYADFVVPLVKAMQEQQQMINALIKQNADLQKRVLALEKK